MAQTNDAAISSSRLHIKFRTHTRLGPSKYYLTEALVLHDRDHMGSYPIEHQFWAGLLRKIARRTRGRDDAEDLLHTAFIRLERYRAKYTVRNPAAFIVKTAVNIGIDRHRHDQLYWDSTTETELLNMPDDGPSPDEVIDGHVRLDRARTGLAQLSPRTREIFLMHRLDGMKYREIAVRLGLSQSAVEKHIAKAAFFLSEWLEDW